ncbi:hypothetical protein H4R33_005888, partial [Dimargaris cristalligena]
MATRSLLASLVLWASVYFTEVKLAAATALAGVEPRASSIPPDLPRPPLMGDQVAAGVFFLLFGLYYYFFLAVRRPHGGHGDLLFLTGFLILSLLVYYVCIKVRPAAASDMARRAIYLVISLLLGLVGGFVYLAFLPDIPSRFGVGGLAGFAWAMVLLALCDNGLLEANAARGVFIATWATFLGTLAAVVVPEPALAVSTAVTGAYLLVLGVDFFARTGFKEHLTAFTHATYDDFYHPGRAA